MFILEDINLNLYILSALYAFWVLLYLGARKERRKLIKARRYAKKLFSDMAKTMFDYKQQNELALGIIQSTKDLTKSFYETALLNFKSTAWLIDYAPDDKEKESLILDTPLQDTLLFLSVVNHRFPDKKDNRLSIVLTADAVRFYDEDNRLVGEINNSRLKDIFPIWLNKAIV
jgi:hypothetical protein